jgi:hypothetical protein
MLGGSADTEGNRMPTSFVERLRRGWLLLIKNTLNRITRRLARRGWRHFSLIFHVGRRSGKPYETPVLLAPAGSGFVAELTYGPRVDWYRNITAAGSCDLLYAGRRYHIDRIERCSPEVGLRAFGNPAALVLQLLHRREFRLLHIADEPVKPGDPTRP